MLAKASNPVERAGSGRRDAILAGASDLFLQQGFDTVSVDAIIARVGGSKTNVYRFFGSKDGLLAALVEQECKRLIEPLRGQDLADLGVRETLERLAAAYLAVISDAKALALHRLVIAQARRFPALAATFLGAGPDGAAKIIATSLQDLQARGLLDPTRDPLRLARQFMNLLRGDAQTNLLMCRSATLPAEERATLSAEAIATLLEGAAVRRRAKTASPGGGRPARRRAG